MIKTIQKRIKTNIAQHTNSFDIETKDVLCTTKNNKITIPTLEGEYTLSNATDGIASKGCLNDTYIFKNGSCTTDCFFGKEENTHNLTAHKVKVGTAFRRDLAIGMLRESGTGNRIVIYFSDARSVNDTNRSSLSIDLNKKISYTIGILFKMESTIVNTFNSINYDMLLMNSVVGAQQRGSTLVEFKSVLDRFKVGDDYTIDMEFGFTIETFLKQNFIDSLKHSEFTINNLTTKEK